MVVLDNDYLNAVYLHLPKYNQTAWDMFDTDVYDDEWQAFMVYMHDISTAALKKRTRVESLKEMEKAQEKTIVKKKVSTLAAAVSELAGSNYDDSDGKQEKYKAKFEEIKRRLESVNVVKVSIVTRTSGTTSGLLIDYSTVRNSPT